MCWCWWTEYSPKMARAGRGFDCGRDEGRDGCRWAGSGGGQSRIKGTVGLCELAVAEWKGTGTAALVACVVGAASGVGAAPSWL